MNACLCGWFDARHSFVAKESHLITMQKMKRNICALGIIYEVICIIAYNWIHFPIKIEMETNFKEMDVDSSWSQLRRNAILVRVQLLRYQETHSVWKETPQYLAHLIFLSLVPISFISLFLYLTDFVFFFAFLFIFYYFEVESLIASSQKSLMHEGRVACYSNNSRHALIKSRTN